MPLRVRTYSLFRKQYGSSITTMYNNKEEKKTFYISLKHPLRPSCVFVHLNIWVCSLYKAQTYIKHAFPYHMGALNLHMWNSG